MSEIRYTQRGTSQHGSITLLRLANAAAKYTAPTAVGPAMAGTSTTPDNANTDGDKHTKAVVKVTAYGAERSIEYALWGTNNLRPDDILKEAAKSGILKAGISTRRDAHYGAGPMYYNLKATPQGEAVQPVGMEALPTEVREFHRRIQLERVSKELIMNWEWWRWYGTEYLLSNNFQKVMSYRPLKTAWVRWSLMNKETGHIEWALMNPNWGLFSGSTVEAIPVADPWWTPEEVRAWAKEHGYTKFVRPSMMPDPSAGYYPDADWHALFDNSWLGNTNQIPSARGAFLRNSLMLKFLIKYPSTYLENKYKDTWGSMKDAERDAKRGELAEMMNNWLSGVENAGKGMVAEFGVDENGQAEPTWQVDSIKNEMGDSVGTSIADSEKGNSEILATLRVDPTLLGQGAPGGKLGAGSGSDKAEAVRILHAMMYGDREITTEPWYFTRDYNGWDPTLYMGYRPMELTAMDAPADKAPAPNAS